MTDPLSPVPPPRVRRLRTLSRTAALTTSLAALALLAVPAVLAPTGPAAAADLAFPYEQTFATSDGGALRGDARIEDGRLRLTDAVRSQAGSWSTTDTFPSTSGLEIEFDYAMYSDGDGAKADGLVMYLADGAAPAGVGATGAGLGYTCVKAATQGSGRCDVQGVPGGFAAIAVDRYGNFSLPINESGPGAKPDAVVVRGSGNGLDGYRFVAGAPAPGFTATDGPRPRKVRVTLLPGASGELAVTVRLEAGGAMRTVLDAVPLHGDGQAPLPSTLRLGFAGATGSFVDVHEIDALRVWQPADLRVEHDMPATVTGSHVAYTVTASNVGTNASAPSPLAVDVPDELHDVRWTCSSPDVCGDASGTGDVATALDLDRGASASVTVEGTLDPGTTGRITSSATIATAPHLADVDERDNESIASTTVTAAAELTTDKFVSPSTGVRPGDQVEYTVSAHNHGPAVATAVSVVDDLPAALAFVDSADGCTAEGQRVTCRTTEDLVPDAHADFRFRAVLDADYRGDGADVVNVATAESPDDPDGGDPSPGVGLEVIDPAGPGDDGDGDGDGDGAGDGDGDGADRPVDVAVPGDGVVTTTPVRRQGSGPSSGVGALAYTGAQDLGSVAAVGLALTAAGSICWWLRRRQRAGNSSAPQQDTSRD